MSSTIVVAGIKPPDEKWRKMKDVWDSCIKAGVAVPKDVIDFFGDTSPDEKGVVEDITLYDYVRKFETDYQDGVEIELDKISPDVKFLRVYISY